MKTPVDLTRRPLWLLASAVITGSCLPLAAVAAEMPTEDNSTVLGKVTVTDTSILPYTVEETSSATKLSLSLRETPQSVTVFTRDRLDDQDLQSLREALDRTPGIYSYAYDSERVLFTARGFVIDSLLYDGVPAVTNFSTDSLDETLDTALYERIEIVRGATGLMTGAGSPAASVNLVRKHANNTGPSADFAATAGSWDNRRFEADLSAPLTSEGSVRARVVGVYQDRDSYQDLYENKKRVFYGVIDADITINTRASLGFDYQDNEPRSNTWGSFPLFLADGTAANWPRSVTTATDWSFWDRSKKTVFGELAHAFDNGWALRSSLSWRKFNEDLALFYMFGFPDPETGEGLEPSAYRSSGDITETALDLYMKGAFNWFGRQHELVIGYNGSKVDNDSLRFQPGELASTGNFFEWDGSYPQPEFATEGTLLSKINTRQHGFYSSARFVLADPLKLIAGARYSTWKTDSFYLDDSPDITFNYDYEKTVPYAGLIYDISRSFSAFASFTEIFKPQNSRDVNGTFLDPIDGRSFEVGIKGEHLEGRLNTALTFFETRQNNVATADLDPETGETILLPDGTQASRPIDGTRASGFELEASGELRPGLRASLGWSRYTLKDADDAAVRTFVPRTLVRAFTAWTAPGALSKLTIGGGVNWQSASHTLVGSPDGGATLRQGAVTLVSVMARYQLNSSASVQINGENLLDKKYYVLDEFDNTYYGAPASLSIGLNLRF